MNRCLVTQISIVRDQEHYVKEWLAFHRIVGVDRFVILLHKCCDKTEERIRELPFQDRIMIHRVVDDRVSVQMGAYHWAVRKYAHHSKWLLFIDADEFFFGTREDYLPNILRRYDDPARYGGLAAHWVNFGHNNHPNRESVFRDGKLSIEAFTTKNGDPSHHANRSFKCIIPTRQMIAILSPHKQLTINPIVREDFKPLIANHYETRAYPITNIVRCHHYHTRSMEDWVERSKRGSCNTVYDSAKTYNVTRFVERGGNVEDKTIVRFAERIKEMIR